MRFWTIGENRQSALPLWGFQLRIRVTDSSSGLKTPIACKSGLVGLVLNSHLSSKSRKPHRILKHASPLTRLSDQIVMTPPCEKLMVKPKKCLLVAILSTMHHLFRHWANFKRVGKTPVRAQARWWTWGGGHLCTSHLGLLITYIHMSF